MQDYKPPTALDIPEDFRVTFLPNAAADEGMLGSKGWKNIKIYPNLSLWLLRASNLF